MHGPRPGEAICGNTIGTDTGHKVTKSPAARELVQGTSTALLLRGFLRSLWLHGTCFREGGSGGMVREAEQDHPWGYGHGGEGWSAGAETTRGGKALPEEQ